MRTHDEQTSSFTNRCYTKTLEKLLLLHKFGSIYLDKDIKRKSIAETTKRYYRKNRKRIFTLLRKECWEYHKDCLQIIGQSISKFELINAVLFTSMTKIFNFRKLVGMIRRS
jgi:hypothetical protein